MSEQKQTSAEIKEQIKKAQEELKNSSLPISGMLANEINANSTTDKAEVKPEQPQAAAKGLEEPHQSESKDSVDFKEWAKKKGIDWTTDDSILKALHKSDQAFHEKRRQEKLREPANQPSYQAPQYAPPPSYQQAPAPYYAPPQNNRVQLENIARQYNMSVEDAERLIAFNKDFFEAASTTQRVSIQKELDDLKRETQKNSVFRELASDPAFRNPEVAVEFHKTLEQMQSADPRSFEEDPQQYLRAYDRTLATIGRRNLMGQELQEAVSPIARPPTNPPRKLSGTSGGGAEANESSMTPQQFSKLSFKEKSDYLTAIGLRPGN